MAFLTAGEETLNTLPQTHRATAQQNSARWSCAVVQPETRLLLKHTSPPCLQPPHQPTPPPPSSTQLQPSVKDRKMLPFRGEMADCTITGFLFQFCPKIDPQWQSCEAKRVNKTPHIYTWLIERCILKRCVLNVLPFYNQTYSAVLMNYKLFKYMLM